MSFAAGAGSCAAGLVAVVLVGCGATASPAQRLARCEHGLAAHAVDAYPIPRGGWIATSNRLCREGSREGKLSTGGSLSNGEQKDIVRRHPEILYPACESLELAERAQLSAAIAKYLPTQRLRRLGRHYCDVILLPRFLSGGGAVSGDESNAISREHPELLSPFCVAGADSEYDKQPRHDLTRADFHRLMSSVCGKAVARGYIRPTGGNDTVRVKALVRLEKARMIRAGEIHLLGAS